MKLMLHALIILAYTYTGRCVPNTSLPNRQLQQAQLKKAQTVVSHSDEIVSHGLLGNFSKMMEQVLR